MKAVQKQLIEKLGDLDINTKSLPEFPNCKGFSQGVLMDSGYCSDCGGHSTDPIHTPKVISTDRMPSLQRDAALNILQDDLQKRVDAVFSIMNEYRSNSVDVMTGMAFDEIEKALKGETL